MDMNEIARVGRELALEVSGAFHDANLWALNANKLSGIAQNLRERAALFQKDGPEGGDAVAVLLMALAAEIDPAVPSDDPAEDSGYGGRKRGSDDHEQSADDGVALDDSGPWEF